LAEKLGIALLGSTGSIGRQTLDVIERHPDRFRVVALAARSQTTLLEEQATRHQPEIVVADGAPLIAGKRALPTPAGLIDAALHPDVDIVVAATSGHDGIRATYAAIQAGKIIALDTPKNLIKQLLARGFTKKQHVEQANLEDVFIHLTGKSLRED